MVACSLATIRILPDAERWSSVDSWLGFSGSVERSLSPPAACSLGSGSVLLALFIRPQLAST